MKQPTTFGLIRACFVAGAVAAALPAQSSNSFLVHNLVSDLPNIADHQDSNLKNPWGSGFGNSPFWIANNGTGTSTLYDGYGTKLALTVAIPAAGGATTPGPVTGVESNIFSAANTSAFVVGTAPASFLFCSLDGVISGWNGAAGSTAKVVMDNSKSGAVYTGCTVGGSATAPMFYAANVNSGKVEAYDASFKPVIAAAFANPTVTANGLVPYNVQSFGGKLYVTYGKQNTQKTNVVNGAGNGAVATFDFNGNLLSNLVAGGPLNSPWGVVLAPPTFGPFASDLLVGNFGDGTINVFDPTTGAMAGTLKDTSGNTITEPGLWSLTVGSGAQNEDPGTVYFTAGIGGGTNGAGTTTDPVESHGLIGSIQSAPFFSANGSVVFPTFVGTATSPNGIFNAASLAISPLAPNTWMTIKGDDLSPITATWQVSGTTLPTALDNVSVTIDGEQAFVSFIGNRQINFLTPSDLQPGATPKVVVTSNTLQSASIATSVVASSPAFFTIGTGTQGQNYIAATHADGSLIGPSSIKGATGAKAGETISLYATGLGNSGPIPNAQLITTAVPLLSLPTVIIEGMVAKVTFAGLVGPGLDQINVVVPNNLSAGDALVVLLSGNTETQLSAYITSAGQ